MGMSYPNRHIDAAERYDKALHKSGKMYPPPAGIPLPKPTVAWPEGNTDMLRDYQQWLLDGGTSRNCIYQIYIPMAGHVLGLNLIPHRQISLDEGLNAALEYIKARQMSAGWTQNCGQALRRFRSYLKLRRGHITFSEVPAVKSTDRYTGNLPGWLVEHLDHMRILAQPNWRASRTQQALLFFWRSHTRLWDWLFVNEHIAVSGGPEVALHIRRHHIYAFIDDRMNAGMATGSINLELRAFQATLRFLQEHEIAVPVAILAMRRLKAKDKLPRFLKDEEVAKLRDYHEKRIKTVTSLQKSRDVLLDRAIFYLMWQAGLRIGEIEDLLLEDVNFGKRQFSVTAGKGIEDRVVYLTDKTVQVLKSYLERRGEGIGKSQDHFFLYRFKGADRKMIQKRINVAGKACGVKVHPHKLRHTFATQLVNAGCPITTIQRLMGHRRLGSTMVYARVHDRTVADDYFKAMLQIERRVNGDEDLSTPEAMRDRLELFLGQMNQLKTGDSPNIPLEKYDELCGQMLELLQRWAL
jgi:site-specific recombinase XerD